MCANLQIILQLQWRIYIGGRPNIVKSKVPLKHCMHIYCLQFFNMIRRLIKKVFDESIREF